MRYSTKLKYIFLEGFFYGFQKRNPKNFYIRLLLVLSGITLKSISGRHVVHTLDKTLIYLRISFCFSNSILKIQKQILYYNMSCNSIVQFVLMVLMFYFSNFPCRCISFLVLFLGYYQLIHFEKR